jgi:hypothetical protein
MLNNFTLREFTYFSMALAMMTMKDAGRRLVPPTLFGLSSGFPALTLLAKVGALAP